MRGGNFLHHYDLYISQKIKCYRTIIQNQLADNTKMNAFTVSLFYLMIPGVLMALIYDKYTQHQKWDNFKYILMSVMFGIVTYLTMQIFISAWQLLTNIGDTKSINWFVLSIWNIAEQKDNIKISPMETLLGALLAIPMGLIAVFLSKNRTIQSFLVRKGISNKYGDDNVFFRSIEDMTNIDCSAYILIQEEDIIIHGYIQYYNESQETQELGLSNVTVYKAESATIIFKTNALYISKEFGKIIIFKDYIIEEESEK